MDIGPAVILRGADLTVSSAGTAAVVSGVRRPEPPAPRSGWDPAVSPAVPWRCSRCPAPTALRVDVVLQPRDPAGLTSYAVAVSTPGSGQYPPLPRRAAVRDAGSDRAQRTIESVGAALAGAGLHPGTVSANDLSIPVRATAAQLATAFSTGFDAVPGARGPDRLRQHDRPPDGRHGGSLVQTVVGLDDLALAHARPADEPARAGPRPRRGRTGGSGGPQAMLHRGDRRRDRWLLHRQPGGAPPTGSRALYDQGDLGLGPDGGPLRAPGLRRPPTSPPTSRASARPPPVTTVDVDGGPLAHSGVGEADVDIEQVAELWPPTPTSSSTRGPTPTPAGYDTYNSIVTQDEAKVVSTSWGLCEPFTGSASRPGREHPVRGGGRPGPDHRGRLRRRGIRGLPRSSGYSDDTLAVDDPASQPFVTGAGGTRGRR